MAELKNTFSWSYSAANDFDECRRRRYWSKYGMWGGWSRRATKESRTAYRLNKMENRHSLKGQAVEKTVIWILKEHQAGRTITAQEAYDTIARPYLNGRWKESRDQKWQENPKKFCCLHEHYYPSLQRTSPEEWTPALVENIKACIQNFIDHAFPRVASVTPADEVDVHTVEQGGDPEHFEYEGLKIYAIPDYVYRKGALWHIHDWKSGKPSESHREQTAIYALWAHVKHGVAIADIRIFIEYLQFGQVEEWAPDDATMRAIRNRIAVSVDEMSDYLVDADLAQNRAQPKEEWDLALDLRCCSRCSFHELCESEIKSERAFL